MFTEEAGPPAWPGGGDPDRLIEKARDVAGRALQRLRGLAADLPPGALEQVERLHRDPASERRSAARVGDAAVPVAVRADGPFDAAGGEVRDHCPRGLSVLLPCPAGVGTVLRVLLPPRLGDQWVTVEVRHCRKEGGGWLAGCELVPGQPPL